MKRQAAESLAASSPPPPRPLGALTNHIVAEAYCAEGDEGEVEALHVVPALHVGEEQWRQQQEEQEAREEGAGACQPADFYWVLWVRTALSSHVASAQCRGWEQTG